MKMQIPNGMPYLGIDFVFVKSAQAVVGFKLTIWINTFIHLCMFISSSMGCGDFPAGGR